MNIFEIMQSSLNGKQVSENEIKSIPSYIYCRYLGSDIRTLTLANFINRYYNLPVDIQYEFVKGLVNGKIKYVRYLKSKTEEIQQDVKIIQQHFNINEKKAREYLDLISKEELNKLKIMYKDINI